jgi:hypothetical protein
MPCKVIWRILVLVPNPHNTAATGDKGSVPVSIVVNPAGSVSLARSDDAGGWILRRAESFSGADTV